MGKVLDQLDRDQAIWAEWVNGSTQAQIAERRGLDRSAISHAIRRYLDQVRPRSATPTASASWSG